jgi:hypothetical protein
LNFSQAPVSLAVKDHLLFAASPADGVAVISLADPLKPSVIRILKTGRARGQEISLDPVDVQIVGHTLHVARYDDGRCIFDIGRPTIPQLGYDPLGGFSEVLPQRPILAHAGAGSLDFDLYDLTNPSHIRTLGWYDARGFRLPYQVVDVFAQTSVAGTNAFYKGEKERGANLALFDTSRPEQITLIDALKIRLPSDLDERLLSSRLTDDGILVVASKKRLILTDTLILDLTASEPAAGDVGVPTGSPVVLRFNRPLVVPAGMSLDQYLRPYLKWVLEDGTPEGQALDFILASDPAHPEQLVLTPAAALVPDTTYRVVLKSELGSRRTQGLFDHTIEFKTGLSDQPLPEILAVEPGIINTTGGEVKVTLRNGNEPVFLLAGIHAPEISREQLSAQEARYVIDAPANTAGPAVLTVTSQGNGTAEVLGAVQYVEPLHLIGLSPAQGSVNGGTRVTVSGQGFQPGLNRVQVFFGGIPAKEADIRVIDAETLEVVTPAGRIGSADVTVTLDNGQAETLTDAFDYQQPIQSNIKGAGGTWCWIPPACIWWPQPDPQGWSSIMWTPPPIPATPKTRSTPMICAV